MRTNPFRYGVVLASSVLVLVNLSASADDKKDKDKPALSGTWVLKEGEAKIAFADKNVLKIPPHGDDAVIVIVCEYSVDKDGLVKAKVTDFAGKDEAKEAVKGILPVGTGFSFTWKVKDNTAKLVDVKCEKAEQLKSHLEGKYSQKK